MVVYRALGYLCGLETFPYASSPPIPSRGDVGWKHIIYFDLPKPVRKMLYNDLMQNVEHLPIHSAAPAPFEAILNAVRLHISSPSYLLDPHAWGGEEGVLTRRKRFDKHSKLQQQVFLGMLSTRLDEGLGKALRAVFSSMFEGPSGMGMRGLNGSSGLSGERAPNCTTISTSTPGAQVTTAISSSSTSTPHASSAPATLALSTASASFASTSTPPAASTQPSAPGHVTAVSTTPTTASISAVTFATTPSSEKIQAARDLTLEKRRVFLDFV